MAFWGVEVEPEKPFRHPPSDEQGKRLHISHAALGIGTAIGRSVVQCNVGENTPVILCSLRSHTAESCQLNLEFQESDEVVFSVLGSLSVHLIGYYVQPPADEMHAHKEEVVPKVVKPLHIVMGLAAKRVPENIKMSNKKCKKVLEAEPNQGNSKTANDEEETRSTIRENADPQCGNEENEEQEKSDRPGEDNVLEAEPNQGNSKTTNDEKCKGESVEC